MKILSFLGLIVLMFLTSQSLYSSATINGTFSFCPAPSGQQYYSVSVSSTAGLVIDVTGGTISSAAGSFGVVSGSASSCPFGGSSISVTVVSSNRIDAFAGGVCDYEIEFLVTWNNSASSHSINAVPTSGSSDFRNITIPDVSGAYITGPGVEVCKSFTGATFNIAGASGYDATDWTSTSSGSSLTIANPSAISGTSITGFTPNNMYSINVELFCNTTTSLGTISKTVVTGLNCLQEKDTNEKEARIITKNSSVTIPEESDIDISGKSDWQSDEFRIFPNPLSKGQSLQVEIPGNINAYEIRLLSIDGKTLEAIKSNGRQSIFLSLEDYSSGIYFIHLQGNNFSKHEKVVVK